MQHNLKCETQYFRDAKVGKKLFEIRLGNQSYQVGDILNLQEYACGFYTGEELQARVIYKIGGPRFFKDGYCALGIMPIYKDVQEHVDCMKECLTESDKQRPGVQWLLIELERAYAEIKRLDEIAEDRQK
ncbi:MAG: DUF3850 domain-containing protein [Ethanoligenens sp.]